MQNIIKLPWNSIHLAFYCCISIESFECLKLFSKLCGWSLCCCVSKTKEKENKTIEKRTSDRETQRIESKNNNEKIPTRKHFN